MKKAILLILLLLKISSAQSKVYDYERLLGLNSQDIYDTMRKITKIESKIERMPIDSTLAYTYSINGEELLFMFDKNNSCYNIKYSIAANNKKMNRIFNNYSKIFSTMPKWKIIKDKYFVRYSLRKNPRITLDISVDADDVETPDSIETLTLSYWLENK